MENLNIFVGSFNINSEELTPEDASLWLAKTHGADVVALGFQEYPCIPGTNFPPPVTHLSPSDYVRGEYDEEHDARMERSMRLALGGDMVKVADVGIGEPPTHKKIDIGGKQVEWYGAIRLVVFVREALLRSGVIDSIPMTFVVPGGHKPSWKGEGAYTENSGDKGGVAVYFPLQNILFANCHLEGTNKYKVAESVFDQRRVTQLEKLRDTVGHALWNGSRVMLFGDLNFRCEVFHSPAEKEKGGKDYQFVKAILDRHDPDLTAELFFGYDRLSGHLGVVPANAHSQPHLLRLQALPETVAETAPLTSVATTIGASSGGGNGGGGAGSIVPTTGSQLVSHSGSPSLSMAIITKTLGRAKSARRRVNIKRLSSGASFDGELKAANFSRLRSVLRSGRQLEVIAAANRKAAVATTTGNSNNNNNNNGAAGDSRHTITVTSPPVSTSTATGSGSGGGNSEGKGEEEKAVATTTVPTVATPTPATAATAAAASSTSKPVGVPKRSKAPALGSTQESSNFYESTWDMIDYSVFDPCDPVGNADLKARAGALLERFKDTLCGAMKNGQVVRPTFTYKIGSPPPPANATTTGAGAGTVSPPVAAAAAAATSPTVRRRNYAVKRTPSWPDRVLWAGFKPSALHFDSVPEVCSSDHEPVFALFTLPAARQLPHTYTTTSSPPPPPPPPATTTASGGASAAAATAGSAVTGDGGGAVTGDGGGAEVDSMEQQHRRRRTSSGLGAVFGGGRRWSDLWGPSRNVSGGNNDGGGDGDGVGSTTDTGTTPGGDGGGGGGINIGSKKRRRGSGSSGGVDQGEREGGDPHCDGVVAGEDGSCSLQ